MTLNQTLRSVHSLSHGVINGERMSLKRLTAIVTGLFRGTPKLGNRVAIEVTMPDGVWLCEIVRYADRRDGYDYDLPETREQEARIWAELLA